MKTLNRTEVIIARLGLHVDSYFQSSVDSRALLR